ncbi:putative methyltransferase DDB_G0268948 [Bombina bombina]|uniref:putative methyltransferase DDB_G0268948 n=1 Tax=Bombina bombina TaxID=8345 RepID=UPI00235AEC98|nr:putative methyltransferase DDB_G0268948 [Bombina bombina]XP_053554559.1 putative methyltransferase DDB_G0268948 [Bombina bombina]XP_053554561.1 putative methyltransferase DDB_G0268948 [Bombina bombina]XP_053554562.1 putative methyltransferase DDB_G0268948 [Bombina bombina]
MATRLFEGKGHASVYKKYRFSPPQEIQDLIFNYLGERLTKPYELAVDVGCGTGQSARILVPYFQKVIATDISEAQIEEAKTSDKGIPNLNYIASPAEICPVDDASVDLLTACAAVHWFNIETFLKEVDRILKPGGCLAFFTYTPSMEVHYKDRSEQMIKVFNEVQDILAQYQNEKVKHVKTGYKEIFEAIPYTDKKRIENIITKSPMSIGEILGLIQTFSMYQSYLKVEPEKAKELLATTEQRFLEIMGVTSLDTSVELCLHNVCVLASKPK